VIGPKHFCPLHKHGKAKNPIKFIQDTRGDEVAALSQPELLHLSTAMLLHRHTISEQSRTDLSQYTREMARILDVTFTLEGQKVPVLDKSGWIKSLIEDKSDLQIQKFIFAWMHIRRQYRRMLPSGKGPAELFEDNCMRESNLVYCPVKVAGLKKNEKTCIVLLYGIRERNWRETMLGAMRDHLNLVPKISAPAEVRDGNKDYRRGPSSFFLGTWKQDEKKFLHWTEVSQSKPTSNSIGCSCQLICLMFATRLHDRYLTRIVVCGRNGPRKHCCG